MKFILFIFKNRFRRSALNNLLKKKKIKNFLIINLTGPIRYYLIGSIILFLNKLNFFSKNFCFISCDGRPIIKKNGINLWFGGTSLKIQSKYKHLKNNCTVLENFYKKEKNLIKFAPIITKKNFLKKNYKFLYLSEITVTQDKKIIEIWKKNKKIILNDLTIIEKKNFWKRNNFKTFEKIQRGYIDIKNLIRLELVLYLKKVLKKQLIIYGSTWKKYIVDAKNSNYDQKFTNQIYKGNICIDFGSKWCSTTFYPRSIEIIENGGHLLQAKQVDSKKIFSMDYKKITFNSLNDLKKTINNFISDEKLFLNILKKNENKFININNIALKKIFNISNLV
jgi:hypothetical protein